jgi:Uri superfamily endonuclease
MNANPGTYALVLYTTRKAIVQIGRWGNLALRPGYYIYVGSAFGPGGVWARVSRHCRESKSKHWHIDYLREKATVESVWYSHRKTRLEHRWAIALANWNKAQPVPGFGCSDCGCDSHLFYFSQAPILDEFARTLRCSVESCTCEEARSRASAGG